MKEAWHTLASVTLNILLVSPESGPGADGGTLAPVESSSFSLVPSFGQLQSTGCLRPRKVTFIEYQGGASL